MQNTTATLTVELFVRATFFLLTVSSIWQALIFILVDILYELYKRKKSQFVQIENERM